MPRIGLSTVILAAALAWGVASAQDPARQDDEQAQTERAEPETSGDASEQSAPQRPEPDRDAGAAADDVFVPTEEIGADEEVTFPVDI